MFHSPSSTGSDLSARSSMQNDSALKKEPSGGSCNARWQPVPSPSEAHGLLEAGTKAATAQCGIKTERTLIPHSPASSGCSLSGPTAWWHPKGWGSLFGECLAGSQDCGCFNRCQSSFLSLSYPPTHPPLSLSCLPLTST